MSAKPRFKPIMMELRGPDGHLYKTRATDARDLTVEQAIAETITRNVYLDGDGPLDSTHTPEGHSARVVNGKVRVRRVKQ